MLRSGDSSVAISTVLLLSVGDTSNSFSGNYIISEKENVRSVRVSSLPKTKDSSDILGKRYRQTVKKEELTVGALADFAQRVARETKQLDDEFSKLVSKNFMDLI